MDDAWQSQDMAPPGTAISIPATDLVMQDDYAHDKREDNMRRSMSPGGRGETRRPRDDGETNPGNNLHVSGLSRTVDMRDLDVAFSKVGRVQKTSIMYDPHTRESRGFGFVTMETPEEADAAIAALNGTEFMGRTMNIERARRGRARTPTPGKYYGPPKRNPDRSGRYPIDRPYDPRPYDSRYSRDSRRDRYDERDRYDRRNRYDDRDRRDRYDDRDRRDRYDDRDRRYDDRRY